MSSRQAQARYRSISALWLIEQYGGMGSIPPPTSTPIWPRVAHARAARATGPLASGRHRHRPAGYLKGPPQVHHRSVRSQRKLAQQTASRELVRHGGRWILQAMRAKARAACCRGVAAQKTRHGARRHSSVLVQGDARYQQGCRDFLTDTCGPCAGQTADPPVISRWWRARGHRDRRASGSVNRCLRILARAIRPHDRAHDRGRCPLYVRAQLDTVGLSWTQRDLVRLKATARETGKTQLTGYLRRWWQVLGSNQRRLSRRFYRPFLPICRNGR